MKLGVWVCSVWLTVVAGVAGALDQWIWRNPLPFGWGISDIAPFKSGAIASTSYAGLMSRTNEASAWEFQRVGPGEPVRVFDGGDRAFFSRAFWDWPADKPYYYFDSVKDGTVEHCLTNAQVTGFAVGNGRYLASSVDPKTIFASTNGTNWREVATNVLTSQLLFANGYFFGYGPGAPLSRSQDGVAWHAVDGTTVHQLAYADGRFLRWSPGDTRWSTNELAWTQSAAPVTNVTGAVAGGGLGMLHYRYTYAFSRDYTNWVARDFPFPSAVTRVVFINGKFWAVGDFGLLGSSGDLENWTPAASGVFFSFHSVAASPDRIVVLGRNGRTDGVGVSTNAIIVSTNGIDWRVAATTPMRLNSVVYGFGQFIAAGEKGALFTSTDGENWIRHELAVWNDFDRIVVTPGAVVALAFNQVARSSDAKEWEVIELDQAYGQIGWDGEYFILRGWESMSWPKRTKDFKEWETLDLFYSDYGLTTISAGTRRLRTDSASDGSWLICDWNHDGRGREIGRVNFPPYFLTYYQGRLFVFNGGPGILEAKGFLTLDNPAAGAGGFTFGAAPIERQLILERSTNGVDWVLVGPVNGSVSIPNDGGRTAEFFRTRLPE